MWPDTDGDKQRRGDEYDRSGGSEGNGPVYDEWWELNDDRVRWRRRFLILCAGVTVLGVCAWLLPAAHPPSKAEAAVARASMDALARRQALPAAATGAAWTGPRMPDVYPTAGTNSPASAKSASPKASSAKGSTATPSTAYRPKAAASGTASPTVSPSGAKVGACAPGQIVLSLFTGEPSYARGAHPGFTVYAVSTAAVPCTLTYGAGAVQVVVTERGHVLWDSANCQPASALAVRFTLGVPQVLTLVWNPAAGRPAGCAGSLPASPGATLQAVAMSHGQSSPVQSFRLAN
jgi:hypothetical protein